jgi:hypothetical protein
MGRNPGDTQFAQGPADLRWWQLLLIAALFGFSTLGLFRCLEQARLIRVERSWPTKALHVEFQ